MLSPADTAIIFVVALLLFGPEQLPKIARQLGETMRNIQHTTQSFMNEMERAATLSEVEEARARTEAATPPVEAPAPEESDPAAIGQGSIGQGSIGPSGPIT